MINLSHTESKILIDVIPFLRETCVFKASFYHYQKPLKISKCFEFIGRQCDQISHSKAKFKRTFGKVFRNRNKQNRRSVIGTVLLLIMKKSLF